MKLLAFSLLGLGLAICGWWQSRDYAWVPADAPRWNVFALKESGIGRTLSRVFTEEANTSFHHGLFEQSEQKVSNPVSRWLDQGVVALGFQGMLKYRPIEKYPLKTYQVRQALEQVEKNLRFGFELDPGNYTAYDVYLLFLTTDVSQTEFGSKTGKPLENIKGPDDDDDHEPSGAQGGDGNHHDPPEALHRLEEWQGQEQQRRHQRAIEITEMAIRKFRPDTLDPERYLAAAVMWYNRFMLLAPDVAARRESVEARGQFDRLGITALQMMQFYLADAKKCERDLSEKGLWETRPLDRRKGYEDLSQFVNAVAKRLSIAVEENRSHMPGSYLGSSQGLGQESSTD